MPKPEKAYKLIKWHSHHEPRKTIKNGLSYYFVPTHAGRGIPIMEKKYGVNSCNEAIGFFARLQQRTARLPLECRGFVLDAQCRAASAQSLSKDFSISEARVRKLLQILVDAKWLRLTAYPPRGRPTGSQKPKTGSQKSPPTDTETETRTRTKTETETRGRARGSVSEKIRAGPNSASASASASEGSGLPPPTADRPATDRQPGLLPIGAGWLLSQDMAAGTLAELLGIPDPAAVNSDARKQALADLTTIGRVVAHHWGDTASLQRCWYWAKDVRSSTSVKKPLAAFTARLKKTGLWYRDEKRKGT